MNPKRAKKWKAKENCVWELENWKKATHSYKLSKLIDNFYNESAPFVNVKKCWKIKIWCVTNTKWQMSTKNWLNVTIDSNDIIHFRCYCWHWIKMKIKKKWLKIMSFMKYMDFRLWKMCLFVFISINKQKNSFIWSDCLCSISICTFETQEFILKVNLFRHAIIKVWAMPNETLIFKLDNNNKQHTNTFCRLYNAKT